MAIRDGYKGWISEIGIGMGGYQGICNGICGGLGVWVQDGMKWYSVK
jgi:hypothetical protein